MDRFGCRVDFTNTEETAQRMLRMHLLAGTSEPAEPNSLVPLASLLRASIGIVLCWQPFSFVLEEYRFLGAFPGLRCVLPIVEVSPFQDITTSEYFNRYGDDVWTHDTLEVVVGPQFSPEMLAPDFPLFKYLQLGSIG